MWKLCQIHHGKVTRRIRKNLQRKPVVPDDDDADVVVVNNDDIDDTI